MMATETRQIPQQFTERRQWIVYRLEERDGKKTKIPYQARNPAAKASSTDPRTWATFAEANATAERLGIGLGYVLTAADGVTFIDLDHCVDPETTEIDGWAAQYVEEANTFTEYSQSGAGLHILAGGSLSGAGKHRKDENGNGVEMYASGRFVAMTGDKVPGTPIAIEPRQAFIDALYAQLADPPRRETPACEPLTCTDAEIVTKACENATTGAEFTRLFAGDLSDVDGDASRGDWKFVRMLRFWTRADAARMDRIYRSSGLRRDKWDSRRGDSTYGARTIAIALDKGGPIYDTGKVILDGIRRNGHTPADDTQDGNADAPALPMLDAGDRQLPRIAAQSWTAIAQRNTGPHLFRFGDVPTRIETAGDGHPLLRALTPDTLRFELARAATWYADVPAKKDRAEYRADAAPPMGVVRDLLAAPEPPLPVLRRLTTAPTFARDFTLRTERGFHDGIYFTGGLTVPTIPERPTPAEIADARGLLYELLYDFPFAQPSDKAHACAMCLQAFVRDLITGPTPLHLISAPAEGTGKGLLSDAVCIVGFGQHAAIMTEGRDADDWRKRVTSYLLMGHQAIQLDNLSRKLDAGSVAAALTSTTWTDRVLGGSTTARLPNTALWIATANNPNLSTEIARRCVRIRIDAKSAHPNRRPASEFRHPDLRRWAHHHRPELVAACLTLVQAWIAAGRPVPTPTLGSFESWAEVIGGVLQVAGIDGFLSDVDEFFDQADIDGNGWRAFVAEWWTLFHAEPVPVADLYLSVYNTETFDALDFGGATDKARRTRLGVALGKQRDKVYGDATTAWRIVHDGTKQGAAQYRLETASKG